MNCDKLNPVNPHQHQPPVAVITRDYGDALEFVTPLEINGWQVSGLPMIECEATAFTPLLREGYDWLVFTSRWGVVHFFGQGGEISNTTRIAVVGNRTAQLLYAKGLAPSLIAEEGTSQSLAETLLAQGTPPQRIVWPCGNYALTDWTGSLVANGWDVTPVVVYHTRLCSQLEEAGQLLLRQAKAIAFTSPSCAHAMAMVLASVGKTLSESTQLLAIGPTTQQALLQTFGRCNGMATPHHLKALAALTVSSGLS